MIMQVNAYPQKLGPILLQGLGFDTKTGTSADERGFMDGLKLWSDPLSAYHEANSIATGTDHAPIAFTAGVVVPPLLAVTLILALIRKHR